MTADLSYNRGTRINWIVLKWEVLSRKYWYSQGTGLELMFNWPWVNILLDDFTDKHGDKCVIIIIMNDLSTACTVLGNGESCFLLDLLYKHWPTVSSH